MSFPRDDNNADRDRDTESVPSNVSAWSLIDWIERKMGRTNSGSYGCDKDEVPAMPSCEGVK